MRREVIKKEIIRVLGLDLKIEIKKLQLRGQLNIGIN